MARPRTRFAMTAALHNGAAISHLKCILKLSSGYGHRSEADIPYKKQQR